MKVYLAVTGKYNCEGCMNSYDETVHGVYSSYDKAQKALEEVLTWEQDYARAIIREYFLDNEK